MPTASYERALAICACLVAPLAVHASDARAQSSITLYGIVDAAVEWSSDDANRAFNRGGPDASDTLRLISSSAGNAKGSRLGVRGVEDLGGGLKAVFAIEHRFGVDTGAQASSSSFWNGQAWVGLDSGLGRLTAGRQYTVLYNALIAVDATADQWYGTLESSSRYATRFDNSIEYRTPSFGGLRLYAMYAFGESQPDSLDQWSVGGIWQGGGFVASAAYQSLDQGAPGDTAQYSVGLAWKPGKHHVGVGYIENDPAAGGQRIGYPFVTLRLAIGPGNLYLNVVRSQFEANLEDSMQYAVAYDLPLSKRTKLYVAASFDTDVRAPDTPVTAPVYVDGQRVSFGIRHDF